MRGGVTQTTTQWGTWRVSPCTLLSLVSYLLVLVVISVGLCFRLWVYFSMAFLCSPFFTKALHSSFRARAFFTASWFRAEGTRDALITGG